MISLIGRSLILLALAASAIGAVVALSAGARKSADGWRWARHLALLVCFSMLAATGLMEYALLTHDFSVSYVAQVGSRSTPTVIAIVSLWSSLEGSILFWGFVLGAFTGGFAWFTKDRSPEQTPYALGVLLIINVFFHFLVASVANPFAPEFPVPPDGPGPNPLLQNHPLMIIHPPTLYLGFVGMSVPFAMAAGALLAGKLDAAWISALRRWMLIPWSFLSLGIMLGGWWSYEVLGWGGYWAWDPVENASFMPWLTATAFLHSAMVMERRGAFKVWTLSLAMASFLLTLLGTFMTRSGVFNSVHSFTQSSIGPAFLVFIAISLTATVILLASRMDIVTASLGGAVDTARGALARAALGANLDAGQTLALEAGLAGGGYYANFDTLRSTLTGGEAGDAEGDEAQLVGAIDRLKSEYERTRRDQSVDPASKPGAFMANNLLFTAFTFTVLLGTLFPLINEALTAERISVGQPYFNKMTLPLCVALLFLMGVGPALPWGRPTSEQLKQQFTIPAIAGVVAGVLCAVVGLTNFWALSTFVMSAFALTVSVREFTTPARARAKSKGESFGTALMQVISRGRRRFTGHVVHLGVIVLAMGVAVSSTWRQEADVTLKLNESVEIGDYTVTYLGAETFAESHRKGTAATYGITAGGRDLGELSPRMNHYPTMAQPIPTPDVRTGAFEDLYLSLIRVDGGSSSVKIVVEPLVSWVWIGGIIMFVGGLLSMVPWGRASAKRAAKSAPAAAK